MKKRSVSRQFLVGSTITLTVVCGGLLGFVKWQNENTRRANWKTVVLSVRAQYVATDKTRIASLLLTGPPTAQEMVIQQELQKLQVADLVVDFEKAWQQGDHRFAGVNGGVGTWVPSPKGEIPIDLLNKYGIKTICSPGDVLAGGVVELGQMGDKYAKGYNQLLLKKLNLG